MGNDTNLLFVANFSSDTGYAWNTINRLFRGLGAKLREAGFHAYVCYPSASSGDPDCHGDGTIDSVIFDYARTAESIRALAEFMRLLRQYNIKLLYLTDQPTWSPRYLFFHLAGVKRIVVHDRTSGQRAKRPLLLREAKQVLHLIPWLAGDLFIGVSDFVVERLIGVNGTPRRRTVRIYNGIPLDCFAAGPDEYLHDVLGLPTSTRIVFFAGRAQPYKGVPTLIEAAALLRREQIPDLAFVCCGAGPALASFQEMILEKRLDNFFFLGRRDDVPHLLRSATIAVVPSVWAESFGLAVIEAIAAKVPVVASRVGGIPELVDHGETGLLVTPGNPVELAQAIKDLLNDPAERERLARRAFHDVRQRFDIEQTIKALEKQMVGLLDHVRP